MGKGRVNKGILVHRNPYSLFPSGADVVDR